MRDIIITLIVFGSLPLIVKRPYIGLLMWIWISVMNPHRLAYGFAYDFPFALVIAVVTLGSLVVTKEPKRLPMTPVIITLILFTAWMPVTTLCAIFPNESAEMLVRVLKIMTMTLAGVMLIKTKHQLYMTIWTLVGSLAYYGVKGGVFTVLTGGHSIVWGPSGSFIEGNNELALALITIIPMIYCLFLDLDPRYKWGRIGLALGMALCGLAALGSYSRGALLGIVAMALFLWLKSPKKAAMGAVLVILVPIGIIFMPAQWGQRMDTIDTYQQDSSAMGRINAWHMAANLAEDRPLVGGGFEIWTASVFAKYAPVPTDVHAAHSIYFQALGEHGFVGLFLYLLLGWLTWRKGTWIIRAGKGRRDLRWAINTATMIQVSMVGFGVGGAFLSLLYFDVPYYLMACMVCTGVIVEQALKQAPPAAEPVVASRRHLTI